jgi:hypothetical protein
MGIGHVLLCIKQFALNAQKVAKNQNLKHQTSTFSVPFIKQLVEKFVRKL